MRGTAGEPDSAKVKAGEADSGTGQYSAGTNPGAIQQKNSLAEGKKRYLIIAAIAAAAVLLAVLSLFSGRCRADACNNKKAPGSDYCYNHKCNVPDCRNQRLSFSNYCYEHYDLYDDDAKEENGGAYSWELNISDVRGLFGIQLYICGGNTEKQQRFDCQICQDQGCFQNADGNCGRYGLDLCGGQRGPGARRVMQMENVCYKGFFYHRLRRDDFGKQMITD